MRPVVRGPEPRIHPSFIFLNGLARRNLVMPSGTDGSSAAYRPARDDDSNATPVLSSSRRSLPLWLDPGAPLPHPHGLTGGDSMAHGKPAHRTILSRAIAALILVGHLLLQHRRRLDAAGGSVHHVGIRTRSWRRWSRCWPRRRTRGGTRRWPWRRPRRRLLPGGRGYARGYARGRGYGYGGLYVAPGCYWRYGVRVCPYY